MPIGLDLHDENTAGARPRPALANDEVWVVEVPPPVLAPVLDAGVALGGIGQSVAEVEVPYDMAPNAGADTSAHAGQADTDDLARQRVAPDAQGIHEIGRVRVETLVEVEDVGSALDEPQVPVVSSARSCGRRR